MILTGKAKEDFEKWLQERNCNLYDMIRHRNIDAVIVSAYIIEWLDSVNVIIESGIYPQPENNILFSFTIYGNKPYETDEMHNTRHEATTEAIKQANIIYNESN